MPGSVFIIQDEDNLIEVTKQPYATENHLQRLLERYPALLAGDQMDAGEPRRWLLVSREVPVPDHKDGPGRWSLDHLFLDQDGIPTLVEVKRSADTRIRREIVGQMLDYAANALLHWPSDEVRSWFENRCRNEGIDPEEELRRNLGSDIDPEHYWTSVRTNLEAHRIRLLFVADELPNELKRIIEFLNSQMKSTEVLGIELQHYQCQNLRLLIPHVIGMTADAQRAKSQRAPSRQWNESAFLEEIGRNTDAQTRNVAFQILEWAKSRNLPIKWGKGGALGTFYPVIKTPDGECKLFGVFTNGKIEVVFRLFPFRSEEQRVELFQRLSQIEGVDFKNTALQTWGSFSMSALYSPSNFAQFLEVFEWAMANIPKA